MLKLKKGFTLIELIIVIVIIGILAGVVVGVVGTSTQKRARDTKRKQALTEISKAAEAYFADNNAYPADIDALTTTNPVLLKKTELEWEGDLGTVANDIQYVSADPFSSFVLEVELENTGEKVSSEIVAKNTTERWYHLESQQ